MTVISILGGDFEVAFEDETTGSGGTGTNPGMRLVRRTSGAGATVYTTNALYSAIAEITDDFIAMGFKNPMLPVTPNAYTMENQFFIPRSSTEFLKEGAVTADWSITTVTGSSDGHGVLRVPYVIGLGSDFVDADIGREVTDGTDHGTLLDFELEPDGTLVAWIRPTDSTPTTGDIFDDGGSGLEVTTDGGTGAVDTYTNATSGISEWAAIQAIGSVPTATEVFVVQDRLKMTSADGSFQWWATDTAVSLGIISILIRTQLASVVIADGDVEVVSRRYTSLYDNFRLNVAAGGFSALPLASAPDINNTTGYRRVTEVGATGTGPFVIGEIAIEQTTLAKVVITNVAGTTATPILQYYIVGDLTDLFTGGAETLDGQTSGATMTTAAPVANLTGPTDGASGEGGTVTIALGGFLVDHTGDATDEPYSIQIDAQGPGGSGVVIAKTYERLKFVLSRGQTTDLFVGMNVPGETYRGLDGIFAFDAETGGPEGLTEGDDLTSITTSTWTARLLHQEVNNPVAPNEDYITVTDQQTSLDSIVNDDVIADEAGLGVNDVTVDSTGTIGLETFTSPKSAPFGTFTGTQMFGARGISVIGFADADTQAYILTDDLGTLNAPPNTVTYTVNNTATFDRVYVARDDGTLGVVDKDQFGGLEAPSVGFNNQGDVRVRVATAISTDPEIPDNSALRIIETTLLQEHRYRYDALDLTDEEFDLVVPTSDTGTATSTSTTTLTDTGQSFDGATPVEVGDLVRNTFGGKTDHVWEVTIVTDSENLEVFPLYGSADDWDSGDTYEINKLIQTYAATDNIHDMIIDVEAVGSPTSNTFVKTAAADFGTVVQVRQGGVILPFALNQNVNDAGATVTVVRTTDTIFTP